MRIQDAYTKLDRTAGPAGPAKTTTTTATDASKGSAAGAHAEGAATHVALSPRAQALAASADPSAARVDALRAQIARGELQVDARAIAAKLVGDDA